MFQKANGSNNESDQLSLLQRSFDFAADSSSKTAFTTFFKKPRCCNNWLKNSELPMLTLEELTYGERRR